MLLYKRMYDITVAINEEDQVVLHPVTNAGKEFVQSINPEASYGADVFIVAPPEEFEALLPPLLSVGYVCPESGQVTQMSKNRLH